MLNSEDNDKAVINLMAVLDQYFDVTEETCYHHNEYRCLECAQSAHDYATSLDVAKAVTKQHILDGLIAPPIRDPHDTMLVGRPSLGHSYAVGDMGHQVVLVHDTGRRGKAMSDTIKKSIAHLHLGIMCVEPEDVPTLDDYLAMPMFNHVHDDMMNKLLMADTHEKDAFEHMIEARHKSTGKGNKQQKDWEINKRRK